MKAPFSYNHRRQAKIHGYARPEDMVRAVARAARWFRNHQPGQVPPGHIQSKARLIGTIQSWT